MVIINLGNVGSEEQAQRIHEKINGQTFYDFKVEWSPSAGNYPVHVWTDYPDAKKKEVRQMLLFVMACEI